MLEAITAEVKVNNCACEVRNPAGKCCLGEVAAAIKELKAAAGQVPMNERLNGDTA